METQEGKKPRPPESSRESRISTQLTIYVVKGSGTEIISLLQKICLRPMGMSFRRPWCTEFSKGVEKEGTTLVTEPARPNDSSLSVWRIKRLQSRAKLSLTIFSPFESNSFALFYV